MSNSSSLSSSRPRWVQGLLHPRSSGVFTRSRSPSRERSTAASSSSISLPPSSVPVTQLAASIASSTNTAVESPSTLTSQDPSSSSHSLTLSPPSVSAPASSAESSTTPAADSQSTVPAIPPPAPPPRPAPADPLAALWEQAIERYKGETSIDLFAQDDARFESESAILHYLDEQEKSFSEFRARDAQRLRTALAPVAGACGPLCAIAGEGVGLVFAPSKMLFTAIGELVKAAVKISEELDSIVGAFDTIEHHLRILKPAAARDVLHDEALREASVKLLAQILVVFGVIQKAQNDGRLVLWLKKLAGSKQVSSALDDLGRLATNQHQTISAVTLYTAKETMAILIEGDTSHQHEHELTRKSLAEITKIAQEVHDIVRQNTDATQGQTSVNRGVLENIQRTLLQQINNMNLDRNTANIEKIFQWLQYPDSSVKMNTLLDDRAESTGSWFLDGDEYSAFKRGERKCLWLHGKAGCGKSTMIAAVIRDLQVRAACSATTALTITHLFDTTNGSHPRNLRALLSSLLCQLAYNRDECAVHILKLRTGAAVGASQLSLDTLQDHVDTMLESMVMRVFIVVDALDEAEDNKIIPFIAHLRTHANVSLILSSRHEALFQADLEGLSDSEIPMREDLVVEDITLVLERLLRSGGALDTKTDQHIKDRIREVIQETADGNFRWAALQLQELGTVAGIPRKVLERLKDIPKTLAEEYERRLQAINLSDRKDAACLLTWSLFSHRPLSTIDFAQLLSFDYSDRMPVFDASMQPSSVVDVLSLVGSTFLCEHDGVIRIAHASVKDYLLELPTSSPFHVNPEYAYSFITRTCLAYLKCGGALGYLGSAHHIIWTWVIYASKAAYNDTLEQDIMLSIGSSDRRQLLATASLYGAVQMGHVALVRLLVDHLCANVDGRAQTLRASSILAVVMLSNTFVFEYTEDDASDTQRHHCAPLHFAAHHGHTEIVHILLNAGADVDPCDGTGATPLHFATMGGHLELVRLLIERHANVHARSDYDLEPLHMACLMGYRDIAYLLVEARAGVNSSSGSNWTPLHGAACAGHPELVRFLIDRHADVRARLGDGREPLHIASLNGHKDATHLLVEAGADVNSRSNGGWTPLHATAEFGRLDLVRFLIERHADVHACSEDGRGPLYLACLNGHKEVAQLLVEAGADVNSRSANGTTPLHAAVESGHLELVSFLIDQHVDIRARNDHDYEPLHLAAGHGHVGVVRLLLEHNAVVDARTKHASTPLILAAESTDKPDLLSLLIAQGADIHARDNDDDDALQCAVLGGHENNVRFLLSAGSPPRTRNAQGLAPIDRIGQSVNGPGDPKANERVRQILLDAGAMESDAGDAATLADAQAEVVAHEGAESAVTDEGAEAMADVAVGSAVTDEGHETTMDHDWETTTDENSETMTHEGAEASAADAQATTTATEL